MDKFPHGAEGWSDARGQNLVGNGLVAQDHFISAKERGLMGQAFVKTHKADPIATCKVSSPPWLQRDQCLFWQAQRTSPRLLGTDCELCYLFLGIDTGK